MFCGIIEHEGDRSTMTANLILGDPPTWTKVRHLTLLSLVREPLQADIETDHVEWDSDMMVEFATSLGQVLPHLETVRVRVQPCWDGFLDAARNLRDPISSELQSLKSVNFIDVGCIEVVSPDGLRIFLENRSITQTWHWFLDHAPDFLTNLMARPGLAAAKQAAIVSVGWGSYMRPPIEEVLSLSNLDQLPLDMLSEMWAFMLSRWPEYAGCDLDGPEFWTYILQLWDGTDLGPLGL